MEMQRPRRRRWPLLAIPALVVVAILALPFLPKSPLPVETAALAVGLCEETVTGSSVGTVEAEQTAVVAGEVGGPVASIRVRQGPVRKGDVIVTIDPEEFRTQHEQTARDLVTWRLRAEQAKLRVERAEAELKRSSGPEESEWRREQLAKDLAIAKKDFDIAEASVKTQEAALDVVELRLRKSAVAAPFDGILTRLHVEVGENVTPGRQLFTIQSAPPYLVRAPVDETDLGRLALGQEAKVTFDAFRDRSFAGELIEIKPAASVDQKNNRTVDVKVRVKEMPPQIVTGMSSHLEIILRKKPSALRIATAHIREDHATKTRYVFVVDGSVARKRVVRTGLWNWEWTEVVEGLAEGDRVVVRITAPDREGDLADGATITVKDGR
jgi:HlyD family secretion protein